MNGTSGRTDRVYLQLLEQLEAAVASGRTPRVNVCRACASWLRRRA